MRACLRFHRLEDRHRQSKVLASASAAAAAAAAVAAVAAILNVSAT